MNQAALAVRQEIHNLIDTIPERNLYALRPLLNVLVDYPVIIETDLTDEEKEWIREGDKHYSEHPEDFVPLVSIK